MHTQPFPSTHRPADLRIVRFIGSGGFGDCFLGKWLGVEVASKCNRDLPDLPACSKVCLLVCLCVSKDACVCVYKHMCVFALVASQYLITLCLSVPAAMHTSTHRQATYTDELLLLLLHHRRLWRFCCVRCPCYQGCVTRMVRVF